MATSSKKIIPTPTTLADQRAIWVKIEKKVGKGVLFGLDGALHAHNAVCEVLSTGSLKIDQALGVGGIPYGRIVELYGPESSGKTTLALHILAEAQKKKHPVLLIDAEHAFDPVYAENVGVDTKHLMISQPSYGEQAMLLAQEVFANLDKAVVVIDSVAALLPKQELMGEPGEGALGGQARMMSLGLRKLTGKIHRSKGICVFINQLRSKIGQLFGSSETTSGGKALKYYASMRLDIRRGGTIRTAQNHGEIRGHVLKVKVTKNKIASPFQTTTLSLIYGRGIDYYGELLDIGLQRELILQSGAWFAWGKTQLGQGKEAAKQYIKNCTELKNLLQATS